jgi:hypothetical protein
LRAKLNIKTKEVGLRKFYSLNQYERLKSPELINDLLDLSNFWLYVNKYKKNDELQYEITTEARKYFHCLSWYPNEFWKYVTSVFFFKNKEKDDFNIRFPEFLKNLTAYLFVKFIDKPTVNAIKDDIYQTCIAINQGLDPNLILKINSPDFKQRMSLYSSSKLSRSLILLHAYLNENQTELLPITFDVEHIFPKKWQNTNYFGWNENDAQIYLEKFGNKVAIEKKLNIQAGNGYFGIKKLKYSQSKIKDVNDLSIYQSDDWAQADIIKREESFLDQLTKYFESCLTKS